MELTEREFWDHYYDNRQPRKVTLKGRHLLEAHLKRIFRKYLPKGQKTLIEFGSGGSQWLPYFSTFFHYGVTGIDYSTQGVTVARQNLKLNRVSGRIIQDNFLAPKQKLPVNFDVALSLGVVEHFRDTARILRQFSLSLKENGVLVTGIPKLRGFQGVFQRFANYHIYTKHIPMNLKELIAEHESAGLQIIHAWELGLCGLGLNFGDRKFLSVLYRLAKKLINILLMDIVSYRFTNRMKMGSYYLVLAHKPAQDT